jgi:hypothetical protein
VTNFIALSGPARSGKDTAAKYLIDNYGYTRVSFAAPIRQALYRLNPKITLDGVCNVSLQVGVNIYGWDAMKTHAPEIRDLLQRFGTEVGREMFGDDIWVNIAINEALKHEKAIFTDCRYPNEAEAVRAIGGQIWKIERDGVEPANSHTSEHAMIDYSIDRKISNNGSLDELNNQLVNIFK